MSQVNNPGNVPEPTGEHPANPASVGANAPLSE